MKYYKRSLVVGVMDVSFRKVQNLLVGM